MPAKSQVPARLPAYFPSNSRQFYEERHNSLPKEPPSSPIARGIPFVRRRQLWLHPSGHHLDPSTARFHFDVNFCRRGSPIWPINLLTTRSYSIYRIKALRHSLEGTT
ncbi:hypothetical protein PVAP13_1NG059600 [Panicum virgatum]|uniref:Uncharacterized protein n=1 Tax=Panicum virgatum TaxID=38727 RepID=A0A8T0WV41_PANVG|nr:hypothetical protein PVAP13_1NG059600 [Panicum virgatum]